MSEQLALDDIQRILSAYDPKDLIDSSWISTYEGEIAAIWYQLASLNSNVYILEQIVEFPFGLFRPESTPFWPAIKRALYEASLMIIWRIAVDNAEESHLTLQQLKNAIQQHMRAERAIEKRQFADTFKTIDRTSASLKKQVKEIRHNSLAHFDRTWNVNHTPEEQAQVALDLAQLKELRDNVKALFDLLCFSHGRRLSVLHLETNDPNAVSGREVENLLDSVAKNSRLLNWPECAPYGWSQIRPKLTPEQVETLNKYRRKFGLPEM